MNNNKKKRIDQAEASLCVAKQREQQLKKAEQEANQEKAKQLKTAQEEKDVKKE